MSIDSEDTPLEQALRCDLPSQQASTRMRRRLLAAGVAVGNGMAVTSAAAAGTTPGLIAGTMAKAGALSWGVKLGFAAAITIPAVGLVAERLDAPTPAASSAQAAAVVEARPAPLKLAAPPPETGAVAAAPSEPVAVAAAAPVSRAQPAAPESAPGVPRPSQLAFDANEPAAPSKATSTLAEETRILDAAFAALAAGEHTRAAELVREHEARFPAGLLGRERERAKSRLREGSRGN